LILYVGAVLLAPLLLFCLVWWVHYHFWRRRLVVAHDYAHTECIALPDGGTMELRRIGAPIDAGAQGETSRVPVLLIHGLAMGHRNHDALAEASLARYLHEHGRDVWLVTLRSGCARWSVFGPRHCTFAAMAKHDVPRAVEAVLAHTGQAQLDVAGFSMGGMLLYASLGRALDAARVRRAAVFAAPAKIRPLAPLSYWSLMPAALTPMVPMKLWTRSFAWAPRWVSRLLWSQLYNPENVERALERRMLWNVWEDIPGQLGAEFLRWSRRGGELTVDGARALDGLARVNVPVCFFAGSVDWLAPEWSVRAGFEAWGSALPQVDKHFVVLGRQHGTLHEYGHCDIAFGRRVRSEVFEPAARFLESGSAPRAALPHTASVGDEAAAAE
jgi:pimeloyl-ACP methyl ester carboxylesterase